MFLHVWKAIDNTIILALSYFQYNFLLLTDDYFPHTVLDCKVINPQATTSSYAFVADYKNKDLSQKNVRSYVQLEGFRPQVFRF